MSARFQRKDMKKEEDKKSTDNKKEEVEET